MNQVQKKKEHSKTNGVKKGENPNADPKWQKQNQSLQATASANIRLHQQITKESSADSMVQIEIQDKVASLKDKASKLAKTLESEKRKNIQLQAIIRHMKFIMDEEKKVQASHRDDMNYENMDNLNRKIKKYEYDLEQMYSRNNEFNSKIRIQKNQIDASRTQRVIDSTIFLKIQKQIVFLELEYKKLLIEKTRFEKEYMKSLSNYKKIKSDIEKEHSIISSKKFIAEKEYKEETFFQNAPQIEQTVKFTDITVNTTTNNFSTTKKAQSRKFSTVNNQAKNQINQELEIKVKKILLLTGLKSSEDLIEHLHNIDKINEGLFKEVNEMSDQINRSKEQIQKSASYKKKNAVRYYDKEPQMTKAELQIMNSKNLAVEILHTEEEVELEINQLRSFLDVKKSQKLYELFNEENKQKFSQTQEDEKQKGFDDLIEFFTLLEQKMTPIISNVQELNNKFETQVPVNTQVKEECFQDIMYRVKKIDESEKIMARQEFKRQYQNLKKNGKMRKTQNFKRTTNIQQ